MKPQIEIYVRQSAGTNHLRLFVPMALREKFIRGLESGSFESDAATINLELPGLPEWITDEDQRVRIEKEFNGIHMQIPISVISTYFDD